MNQITWNSMTELEKGMKLKTFKHGLMDVETVFIVYQGGIANVIALGTKGSKKRLVQGDFRSCENYARGVALTGIKVRSVGCNRVGDIIDCEWDEDLGLFRDKMHPVNEN